jgi:hypothetical protein
MERLGEMSNGDSKSESERQRGGRSKLIIHHSSFIISGVAEALLRIN